MRALVSTRALSTRAVVLYVSPRPALVLGAARVLALKSVVCAGGAGWAASVYGTGPGAAEAASFASAAESSLSASLLAAAGADPSAVIVCAFALLSAVSAVAARALTRMTLLRLEVGPAAEELTAFTPRLLLSGDIATTFKRIDVLGARGSSALQGFRVRASADGMQRARTFLLFPVEPGWRSDDIGALRELIFGKFFRPSEEVPGARLTLGAAEHTRGIAGFGSYRPAAAADPLFSLPGARRPLTSGAAVDAATAAALNPAAPIEQRAHFIEPPTPSVAQVREHDFASRSGKDKPLPRPRVV